MNNEHKEENNIKDITCMCSIICGTIALIAGLISFLVFGIIFLVQDWDTYRSCSDSAMGPYVIVALILTWGNGKAAKNEKKETGELVVGLIFYFLMNVGFAIWGGFELWEKSCSDLKDTNLWKFSLAVFIIQITSAVIILLIPCIIAYIATREPDTNLSNTRQQLYNKPDLESEEEIKNNTNKV